jgi:hypothetical protein
MAEETRDRVKSPSINFPQSAEEAQRAIVHQCRHLLLDTTGVLRKDRTDDAGFGLTRRPQQTKWLNDAADLISAIVVDKLDEIEVSI